MKTFPTYTIPEAACRDFAKLEFPIAYGGRPSPTPESLVLAFAAMVETSENGPAAELATANFCVGGGRTVRMTRADFVLYICLTSDRVNRIDKSTMIPARGSSNVVRVAGEIYRRLRAEFGLPKLT